MEIYLNSGQMFAVPAAVADHLLRLASHDQLKVLLYVLCHADQTLTCSEVGKACNVSPDSVEEALVFWENVNVIRNAHVTPTVSVQHSASADQPAEPAAVPQSAPEPAKPQAVLQSSSSAVNMMPSEIAERRKQNPAVAAAFTEVESHAGRMLTHTELKSLIWMLEYLGMQPDALIMLAVYCLRISAFQVRYMEKVAITWQERGICTHGQVEEEIRRMEAARSYTGQVMRQLRMSRQPTEKQQSFIDRWQSMQMPAEMIGVAAEFSRDYNDDRISFPYMDKIISGWHANGIRSAEEARRASADFLAKKKQQNTEKPAKKKPTGSSTSSFDAADLEKLVNQF